MLRDLIPKAARSTCMIEFGIAMFLMISASPEFPWGLIKCFFNLIAVLVMLRTCPSDPAENTLFSLGTVVSAFTSPL